MLRPRAALSAGNRWVARKEGPGARTAHELLVGRREHTLSWELSGGGARRGAAPPHPEAWRTPALAESALSARAVHLAPDGMRHGANAKPSVQPTELGDGTLREVFDEMDAAARPCLLCARPEAVELRLEIGADARRDARNSSIGVKLAPLWCHRGAQEREAGAHDEGRVPHQLDNMQLWYLAAVERAVAQPHQLDCTVRQPAVPHHALIPSCCSGLA